MVANDLSETKEFYNNARSSRAALEKFERSKILEVYFSRIDGRVPEIIPADLEDLYSIELADIKGFLLGQHPQDSLLQKIFKIMN